jgi:hypothetical protein
MKECKEKEIEITIKRLDGQMSIDHTIKATEEEIRCLNIMLTVWPSTLLNLVEDFVISKEE